MSAKHAAFARLKPVCSALLELRQDVKGLAAKLSELLSILTTEDPQGLQACTDYVLFPLLMIVDAAVLSRGVASKCQFFPPILFCRIANFVSAPFPVASSGLLDHLVPTTCSAQSALHVLLYRSIETQLHDDQENRPLHS